MPPLPRGVGAFFHALRSSEGSLGKFCRYLNPGGHDVPKRVRFLIFRGENWYRKASAEAGTGFALNGNYGIGRLSFRLRQLHGG